VPKLLLTQALQFQKQKGEGGRNGVPTLNSMQESNTNTLLHSSVQDPAQNMFMSLEDPAAKDNFTSVSKVDEETATGQNECPGTAEPNLASPTKTLNPISLDGRQDSIGRTEEGEQEQQTEAAEVVAA